MTRPLLISASNLFSALQIVFLFFFLQENNLRKALIPFIGVRHLPENGQNV
jgi:hypothetical protein